MTGQATETGTRMPAFEAQVFDVLLADILRGYPRLARLGIVERTASEVGLPWSVLAALVLLETSRRPWYIAAVENAFVIFNLWLFRWLGLPLLNVSAGPAQVKISTAALLRGIPFDVRGNSVRVGRGLRPVERRRCARDLALIVSPQSNIRLAGAYTRRLLELYCQEEGTPCSAETALSDSFLIYLAQRYNGASLGARETALGFFPYDLLLRATVGRLAGGGSL